MKALVYRRYGGPDVLELADVPKPQPREREVLVRVHATSVNAADRVLLRGKPVLVRLAMGFPRPRHPILGFDVAGRVEAVGSRVTQFRVGEDVFGASKFGAFAEFVCVNHETLVPKPAGVFLRRRRPRRRPDIRRFRVCAGDASRRARKS